VRSSRLRRMMMGSKECQLLPLLLPPIAMYCVLCTTDDTTTRQDLMKKGLYSSPPPQPPSTLHVACIGRTLSDYVGLCRTLAQFSLHASYCNSLQLVKEIAFSRRQDYQHHPSTRNPHFYPAVDTNMQGGLYVAEAELIKIAN
jgi:hypothetical protein